MGYWKGCEVGSRKILASAPVPINTQEYQDLNHAAFSDSFLAGLSRQLPVNALAVLNVVLRH